MCYLSPRTFCYPSPKSKHLPQNTGEELKIARKGLAAPTVPSHLPGEERDEDDRHHDQNFRQLIELARHSERDQRQQERIYLHVVALAELREAIGVPQHAGSRT